MHRRFRAVLPAASLAAVVLLSACGADGPDADPSAAPTPETASATPLPSAAPSTPSDNLEGITVEGAWAEEPAVAVPAPFGVEETLTKVVIPGDGPAISEDGLAEVHYVGINGRTGEVFDESWSRGETAQFQLSQVVPGFAKGLTSQRVGSRVVIAMPGEDGYDSSGGNPQAGINLGDTLVFVVDITDAPLERAEGTVVAPREGLPTVTFDGDVPTVEIPEGSAPSELAVQPLITGTGTPVQASDAITARYQAVVWSTGEVVEDTYGGAAETELLSALIPAWQEALVDQPVGSRLLIVAPPEMAYPEDPGARNPNPAAGQTVVYVVDLLHTQPGQ